tara:strand:+ start:399 stop:1391 length:993 start_codon:yes stop_codon:yes gene_type:complete
MTKDKQLKKLGEILDLQGFKPENPARPENYNTIIFSYELAKTEDIKCSYQKDNGNLCRKEHQHGAVVMLKDGSLSNIGGCCVKNYFSDGGDTSLKSDYTRLQNEIKNTKRLKGLAKLLENEEQYKKKIDNLTQEIYSQKQQLDSFGEEIGSTVLNQLQKRAKESRNQVHVNATTYKKWVDENGHEQCEKSTFPYRIGTIKNIGVFNTTTANNLLSELRSLKQTLELGKAILKGSTKKKSIIDQVVSTLNSLPGLEKETRKYVSQVESFLVSSKLPLLYLKQSQSERNKIARGILREQGQNVGKEVAKSWLREQDKAVTETANCDKFTFIA